MEKQIAVLFLHLEIEAAKSRGKIGKLAKWMKWVIFCWFQIGSTILWFHRVLHVKENRTRIWQKKKKRKQEKRKIETEAEKLFPFYCGFSVICEKLKFNFFLNRRIYFAGEVFTANFFLIFPRNCAKWFLILFYSSVYLSDLLNGSYTWIFSAFFLVKMIFFSRRLHDSKIRSHLFKLHNLNLQPSWSNLQRVETIVQWCVVFSSSVWIELERQKYRMYILVF